MNKVRVPPIKSQGIKTKLVKWIKRLLPDDFDGRWIEPFMGTGVVAINLSQDKAVLCDANPHLINFYSALKNDSITPDSAKQFLVHEGTILAEKGEEHYYNIRQRFNEQHSPLDFLFLNRACFNGMIRFNRKGGFNVPFCRKENRFSKAYISKIVNQISYVYNLLKAKKFDFICQDFSKTIAAAKSNDIIYCDPPYIDRHTDYFNGWSEEDEKQLFSLLCETKARFILSTWHHNDYRENKYINRFWKKFTIYTREHFYHVGASEKNRSPMIEALITNIQSSIKPEKTEKQFMLTLQ